MKLSIPSIESAHEAKIKMVLKLSDKETALEGGAA